MIEFFSISCYCTVCRSPKFQIFFMLLDSLFCCKFCFPDVYHVTIFTFNLVDYAKVLADAARGKRESMGGGGWVRLLDIDTGLLSGLKHKLKCRFKLSADIVGVASSTRVTIMPRLNVSCTIVPFTSIYSSTPLSHSALSSPASSWLPVPPRMTYPFSIPNPALHPITSFPKSTNLTILAAPLLPPFSHPQNMSQHEMIPNSNPLSNPSPRILKTPIIQWSIRSLDLYP